MGPCRTRVFGHSFRISPRLSLRNYVAIEKRVYTRLKSSGMRNLRTLFDLASDWLMEKWSVLIGREKISRD